MRTSSEIFEELCELKNPIILIGNFNLEMKKEKMKEKNNEFIHFMKDWIG